ncbi:MAG: riboflavin kinase [Candidatus Bathyarchaeota archaeon B24]|nr:MAG: riboflavin kinase [Candidatus Bathyarchaeota archaeon B24]
MTRIRGVVASGLGVAKIYLNRPWVRRQLREKLGFDPYPGTLNLKVDRAARRTLEEKACSEIVPAEGFYKGLLAEVFVEGSIRGAVVIPLKPGYPEDLVEIIAAENLREKLNLKDGDCVTIQLP